MGGRPILYICAGSDCNDAAAARSKLVAAARPHASIQAVKCQKICDGPVCGTEVDGRLEWFSEIDSDKSRAALVALLTGDGLAKALKKRRQKKRRGRLRQ